MPENGVLSAIVVSPAGCDAVAPVLRSLWSQSIRDKIEIVLVAPTISQLQPDEELLAAFASWKAVPIGPIKSMAAARAAGVCAASCRYVVFIEEHCFPESKWGQAIVDAFEDHAADVVGPVFINANPKLTLSWAIFLQEYGHWMAPHPGGLIDHLPGHNSAYLRDHLLALGNDLTRGIEAESALHFQWREQGRRLWLEPGARVHHVNITDGWAALAAACAFQRPWANSRALKWTWFRRFLYALASPLIPVVRLPRIYADIRRTRVGGQVLPRILPWIALSLAASSFGELLGYIGWIGGAQARLVAVELYRRRYLASNDYDGLAHFV